MTKLRADEAESAGIVKRSRAIVPAASTVSATALGLITGVLGEGLLVVLLLCLVLVGSGVVLMMIVGSEVRTRHLALLISVVLDRPPPDLTAEPGGDGDGRSG